MLTLLAIISYISFLMLITLPSIYGIVISALLCVVGSSLIFWKKPLKTIDIFSKFFRDPDFYFSLLFTAYFGFCFYNRWKGSAKIQSISSIISIPSGIITAIAAVCLSLCGLFFLYCVIQQLKKPLSPFIAKPFIRILISCVIVSIATVMLAQVMLDIRIFSMGYFKFFWGTLIVFITILAFYCLTGWIKTSIAIGTGIYMLISTINVYIYSFSRRLFEPVDIFSAGTAMNVLNNFNLFPIPGRILVGLGIWLALIIFLFIKFLKTKYRLPAKRRIILAVCCIIGIVSISGYASTLKIYTWRNHGAIINGYILDFAANFKVISVDKPDGYSVENINKTADKYSNNADETDKKPHIIVIMDEAFSDLSILGDIQTNKEVTPFISSLKENTVSGYTLTSISGGTTANSEYEFLTGNSMSWMLPNIVPYQQYIHSSTYSMVSYLKSNYDYQCIAMHPYLASGWNRPSAYSHLGFDKTMFINDFPQKDYIREYISDKEMFDTVIDTYEKNKNNPLFLFGVTMQNHSDYTYSKDDFNKSISLVGYDNDYPKAEQYLSLIHETDKAVEHLVSYFESVDEEVVIVFFGDHQPILEDDFYDNIANKKGATQLEDRQNRYKVPFFIWANYDIEEKQVECTSLNYLSSYVYDVAGLPLPPYNQFLRELEEKIPSINVQGFYSLESGCYLPFDQASKKEKEWILKYEQLQYNSLFDIKNRNKKLFPTLK